MDKGEKVFYERHKMRRLGPSLIVILAVWLMFSACGSKQPVELAPPAPTYFERAEKHYQEGDYLKAAAAYERHLRQEELGDTGDQALFRLALSHALGNETLAGFEQARKALDNLSVRYPESPLAPEARFFSRSLRLIEQLESDRRQKNEWLQKLSGELEELTQRVSELERFRDTEITNPLRVAAQLLQEGSYEEAAQAYRAHIDDPASPEGQDEAHFRLAVIHLSAGTGLRDQQAGTALLNTLVRQWPDSPYSSQARYLLTLNREIARLRTVVDAQQAELKQLNSTLEALKAIDIKRR
jgi:outer membrane protein assembly factor BamD (BamD/ComL family)